MNIESINDELIDTFYGFSEIDVADKIPVSFIVYDMYERVWVELESKDLKLPINKELFEYIDVLMESGEVDYRLN